MRTHKYAQLIVRRGRRLAKMAKIGAFEWVDYPSAIQDLETPFLINGHGEKKRGEGPEQYLGDVIS